MLVYVNVFPPFFRVGLYVSEWETYICGVLPFNSPLGALIRNCWLVACIERPIAMLWQVKGYITTQEFLDSPACFPVWPTGGREKCVTLSLWRHTMTLHLSLARWMICCPTCSGPPPVWIGGISIQLSIYKESSAFSDPLPSEHHCMSGPGNCAFHWREALLIGWYSWTF